MDLAGTPTFPQETQHGDLKHRAYAARALCVEDAASPAFRGAWETLVADASEPNPFLEPWFLLPSLDQFGAAGTAQLLAVFQGDCLIGMLPMAKPQRYYGYPIPHASVWLHENAFCGAPLIAHGFEKTFWRGIFEYFDRHAGRALFLHLPRLPANGPANTALDEVLASTRRAAFTVEAGERAMLASGASPEDYLAASMSAKKRKELRRQHKRLAEEGELVFDRTAQPDGISAWIGEFLALEAKGWKGAAGSALSDAADTRAFFTGAMTGAADAGRLERLTLRLDGAPIAMLANFITPPGIYSFKTSFDERYARFSPGLLLQIENLDLLDRSDIEWADSCAAEGHSMIERIWREKRPMISRNIAIGGPLRRLVFKALMAYETRGGEAS